MLHHIKHLFGALALCCMCCPAIAQESQYEYIRPFTVGREGGIDGKDCKETMAVLDLFFQDANDRDSIIIISWLGRGEASRSLGRRRLRNLRGYLRATRGVKDERIETSEGGRTPGLGKVEMYVGGKLRLVFYLKRNRDFWKGCGVQRKAQSNNGMHPTPLTKSFMIVGCGRG
jgi:hypothetical protein